jgi:hypothetical protein
MLWIFQNFSKEEVEDWAARTWVIWSARKIIKKGVNLGKFLKIIKKAPAHQDGSPPFTPRVSPSKYSQQTLLKSCLLFLFGSSSIL